MQFYFRKAAPIYKKFSGRRRGPGYRQYSRVDVLTQETETHVDVLRPEIDSHVARDNHLDRMMMDQHLDPESDNEDDPAKLLNQWLGELNTLKKVKYIKYIK